MGREKERWVGGWRGMEGWEGVGQDRVGVGGAGRRKGSQ